MLALERLGFPLTVGSIHSPLTTIRHPHAGQLQSPIHYAPPGAILQLWEEKTRAEKRWPETLIETHTQKYGAGVKAALRARNASYFADLFTRNNIEHFHVHFANRAAHTALFLKAMTSIPFSLTAHGQDFMADLGNDDLLREICDAAEFVAVETEYSRGLMMQRCPDSAAKIHRVYNGMNLANFLPPVLPVQAFGPVNILSVGRLVAFKGFDYLIEACEQLRQRSVQFRCEIIGDGPLRESLQQRIDDLRLDSLVILRGALPQDRVLEKLQRCNVFALASTVDDAGASDIFPTVILEAMASARPVVSTTVAGIPEAVVDKETGLLVPPGESGLFAEALEILCRDAELRARYGGAGRNRVEKHFQIETTVRPLLELFEKQEKTSRSQKRSVASTEPIKPRIAYIIDRWPDDTLRSIDTELVELRNRNLEITAFVCEFSTEHRLSAARKKMALQLEFLPDAMAIEAEWQANRRLVLALEDDRANETARPPADLFLRQARFAITLRRMFAQRNIAHVHATSSRALICGVLLKKLLSLSLSASIEAKPAISREVIENSLHHAVGGRVAERKLAEQLGQPFILDQPNTNSLWARGLGWIKPLSKVDFIGHPQFWNQWARSLTDWIAKA
jgi:glycosyltransferase involved in cell wall biosynthesis